MEGILVGVPFFLFVLFTISVGHPTLFRLYQILIPIALMVGCFFFVKLLLDRRRYRRKIKYNGPKKFLLYKGILALHKGRINYEEAKRLILDGKVIHAFEFGNPEYANEFIRCNHIYVPQK